MGFTSRNPTFYLKKYLFAYIIGHEVLNGNRKIRDRKEVFYS